MTFFTQRQVPIGIKIFGIAASMLGLLLIVVSVSSNRLRRVNQEIESLAEYIISMTDAVAKVDMHSLEQEVLFERILKHYEIGPIDQERIAAETVDFERRNREVDQELQGAQVLAEEAIALMAVTPERQELAFLLTQLESVEQAYQDFHDHAVQVLSLLESDRFAEARALATALAAEEEAFDRSIEDILLELEAFTVEAAETGQQHQHTVQQLTVLFELGAVTEASARSAKVHEQDALRTSWLLAAIATALGLTCASLVTLGLVRPLRRLVESSQALEDGNLQVRVPVTSADEVGGLSHSFNAMVDNIQKKEQLKATVGQYADPCIVERLISQSGEAIAPHHQDMTIFFSDMAGFSAISELLTPTGVVTLINQYLTLASEPILAHNGVIDKFLGDAVTAFWGPPFVSNTSGSIAIKPNYRLRWAQMIVGALTRRYSDLQSLNPWLVL